MGRYFQTILFLLILYSIASWPMFVLGIYLGNTRKLAKHSVKRHLITSWITMVSGFCLLLFCYTDWPMFHMYDIGAMVVLGLLVYASAIPAGAAYSKLEKKQWRALMPPAVGVLSHAVLYASLSLA